MPVIKPWVLIKQFENDNLFTNFLLTDMIPKVNHKSQLIKCNLCLTNDNIAHKMSYKLRNCNSEKCNTKESPCTFQYKVLSCRQNAKVSLYSLNKNKPCTTPSVEKIFKKPAA